MTDSNARIPNDTNPTGFPPVPPEPHQRAAQEGDQDGHQAMPSGQGAGDGDATTADMTAHKGDATYSPEDNKLRFYPYERLSAEDYAGIKAAGFAWAPRQQLFVAPMWTPSRAALLEAWCGDIGDEDTTLRARAEDRAQRFDGYSERRGREATAAREQVQAIAGSIPLGQPILVGHHSERRARKDAERIRDGMTKAVRLWETSEYWLQRAEAAKAHANYKHEPDVRYRRIKGIEADLRKAQKRIAEAQGFLALWQTEGLTREQAIALMERDYFSVKESGAEHSVSAWSMLTREDNPRSADEVAQLAVRLHTRAIDWSAKWVAHYELRLSYERAMLGASGGLAVDPAALEAGGRVLVRGEWSTIVRVTKKAGVAVSVTTNARYVNRRGVEELQAYEPPSAQEAAAVKAAKKLPPLTNYPHAGAHEMTKAEWDRTHTDYKGTREVGEGARRAGGSRPDVCVETGAGFGPHRMRVACGFGRGGLKTVFITDAKVVQLPPLTDTAAARPALPAPERVVRARPAAGEAAQATQPSDEASAQVQAMRASLRATQAAGGVGTVIAPQLFPTPATLAQRMVESARPQVGERVLEPSAGTGALLRQLPGVLPFGGQKQTACEVVAVEINRALAETLKNEELAQRVICADFLSLSLDDLGGPVDVVLMNPPFANAADILHIRHALRMLKPGGRLVAICADGPRQREALQDLAAESGGHYEALPSGSFAEVGTGVNTALLKLRA